MAQPEQHATLLHFILASSNPEWIRVLCYTNPSSPEAPMLSLGAQVKLSTLEGTLRGRNF